MHLLQICSPGDLRAHTSLGLGNVQRREDPRARVRFVPRGAVRSVIFSRARAALPLPESACSGAFIGPGMAIIYRVQGWDLWIWPQQKGKAPKSSLLFIHEGIHTNSAIGARLGPGSYRPVRGRPAYRSPLVEFEAEALEGGAGDGSTRGAENSGRSIDSAGRTQHAKYERSLIRPRVDSRQTR